MEFQGKVKKVMTKTFAKKDGTGDITTNEIWVEEQIDKYPQSAVFELSKNVSVPKEGDVLLIQFSMSTNEWQDKIFGKNRAWRIEVLESDVAQTAQTETTINSGTTAYPQADDTSADLPF